MRGAPRGWGDPSPAGTQNPAGGGMEGRAAGSAAGPALSLGGARYLATAGIRACRLRGAASPLRDSAGVRTGLPPTHRALRLCRQYTRQPTVCEMAERDGLSVPVEVRKLVYRSIRSVAELEVLATVQRDARRSWTGAACWSRAGAAPAPARRAAGRPTGTSAVCGRWASAPPRGSSRASGLGGGQWCVRCAGTGSAPGDAGQRDEVVVRGTLHTSIP